MSPLLSQEKRGLCRGVQVGLGLCGALLGQRQKLGSSVQRAELEEAQHKDASARHSRSERRLGSAHWAHSGGAGCQMRAGLSDSQLSPSPKRLIWGLQCENRSLQAQPHQQLCEPSSSPLWAQPSWTVLDCSLGARDSCAALPSPHPQGRAVVMMLKVRPVRLELSGEQSPRLLLESLKPLLLTVWLADLHHLGLLRSGESQLPLHPDPLNQSLPLTKIPRIPGPAECERLWELGVITTGPISQTVERTEGHVEK
ncbi:uncharacterized protein LOC111750332 isoform X2 [Loxodonta africana]|uniref:uncharacterized protein LOC111750332 isoform X2 n=1 Tax=Loxodonta africana TaxID=9785 RepID=UPI0030D120BD